MQLTLENAQPAEMEHLSLMGRCSGLLHKTPVIFMKMPREMSRVSNHVMRFLFDVAVTRAVSTCCGGRGNSAGWRRMKTESIFPQTRKPNNRQDSSQLPGLGHHLHTAGVFAFAVELHHPRQEHGLDLVAELRRGAADAGEEALPLHPPLVGVP